MIRIKFQLTRNGLKKLLDDENLWAKGYKTKNNNVILNCCGEIDTSQVDDEGYDCVFYVEKSKEDWNNDKIKPYELFKARTMLMFKKWMEQYKEYQKKYNKAKKAAEKDDLMKIL